MELNTGILCSCAPSVAHFFRRYPVNLGHFSFQALLLRISNRPAASEGFDLVPVDSPNPNEIRLQTEILGSSVRANGRFVDTQDLKW